MAPNPSDPVAALKPDDVARRTFSPVRKGYDPIEVQGFLVSVATELREARAAISDLERELEAARDELQRSRDLDPSRLTALLGEEMSRVLEAARSASDDLRSKAVAESTHLLEDARAEAARMRADAAEVLAAKTAEAQEHVAGILAQGDVLKTEAESDAADLIERGRQEGREMVAEAQKVRERMLQDLARRRKAFRQQIERLQAGRDRLLSAYDVVRDTLDVATEELQVALPEARLAAETAGLRSSDDGEFTLEDLERVAASLPPSEAEADVEADADADADAEVEAGAEREPGTDPPFGDGGGAAAGSASDPGSGPGTGVAPGPGAGPEPELEAEAVPDKRRGRRSSSVNVIRRDVPEPEVTEVTEAPAGENPEGAAVTGLFARLREETGSTDIDPGDETFELVEEMVVDQLAAEPLDAAPDPDAALVARRDAAMAEVERAMSRRVKRELSDEQNELLDAVRRQKGTPSVANALPALDVHLARYREAVRPGLESAASIGADLIADALPAPETEVGDLADDLAAELVDPLRDRIQNCFREAAGDDEDLAERLRACYREWKGQRVEDAVTRLGLCAANRGLLDGLPEGTMVHWIVADGGSPSPDCDDNALAGDVAKGEPFPTGHVTPPISPHCRCLVAPRAR